MAATSIEWASVVWNPTTGCDRVSPGCDHCYAMTMAKRLKGMGQAKYQTDGDPRTSGPGFGVAMHADALGLPLKWRQPKRIFVNSMSDLFHERVTDEFIAAVFAVMALAPQHTFQVLTKRHARMRSLLNTDTFRQAVLVEAHRAKWGTAADLARWEWPLRNLWLGVSAEDQKWANIRIPALLDTPAAVRWISAEPLLGPIDLSPWLYGKAWASTARDSGGYGGSTITFDPSPLNWVVVGGESGQGARPMDPAWARSLRNQCAVAGVPFLFKQFGAHDVNGKRVGKGRAGRELDGRTHDEYPAVAR